MITPSYKMRIESAKRITEELKDNMMNICWDDDPMEYCSSRSLIPWLQEEAEYKIMHLELKSKDQSYFLRKIDNLVGEYAEMV